jgi:hypothetical protein
MSTTVSIATCTCNKKIDELVIFLLNKFMMNTIINEGEIK